MRQVSFVFETYPDGGSRMVPHFEALRDVSAAKRKAGQMAKRCNGPVDVAYDGDEPWNDRYLTTASPSEFSATGYQFERLS